jgi:HSP20 family protein
MLPTARRHRTLPGFFLNDFFNENNWSSFLEGNRNYENSSIPAVNVAETDKEYVISLAAPGLSKKDFHVTVDNNTLTIASSNEENKEEKQDNFLLREFDFKSFSRSFTLPENAEVEKIEAAHTNGVLNISIAKKEAKIEKTKEISIN